MLKHSLDWAASDDIDDPGEFLHNLKADLSDQEIFVFTPKRQSQPLRRATPLDFRLRGPTGRQPLRRREGEWGDGAAVP